MLLACNGRADQDNGRLPIWAAYKLTLNGNVQIVYGEGRRYGRSHRAPGQIMAV